MRIKNAQECQRKRVIGVYLCLCITFKYRQKVYNTGLFLTRQIFLKDKSLSSLRAKPDGLGQIVDK